MRILVEKRFFLEVEGERKAFDVTMFSQSAVGKNHRRIGMQWDPPKGVIGEHPIRVRAQFVQYEEDIPRNFNVSGRQIHEFFEQKKEFPNELEITLSYRDVDGAKCPPKRFMLRSSRDYRGDFQIACIPIGSQAGSCAWRSRVGISSSDREGGRPLASRKPRCEGSGGNWRGRGFIGARPMGGDRRRSVRGMRAGTPGTAGCFFH